MIATVVARALVAMDADAIARLLRWDALLLGCLLAVLARQPLRFRGQIVFGIAGFLVLGLYTLSSSSALPGAYAITAIASGAALLGAPRFPWLENGVLRYFGRISYSLYLWHVLLLRFAWPGPVSLAASLAAAELSWRYVERRFWVPHD